ncbi:MAG: LysR family transcriptional regulator [Clostridia bacterium]|nr:LysR family transcriptional regulator [Clostridia bacterium]MBQ5813177.1 LysR family transcriptional regulator [Clostridia bacterium]
MTNRNLEIFVAVAEYGKMSLAARQLYITQSSVSQAISEIEKEYGVLLFERLSRRLHLTDTGRDFLEYAKKTLALQQEMDNFLRDTSRRKKIRIGATLTVGASVISPIVSRLKELDEDIIPEVTVANTHILEEKLLRSQLDIGFVEGMIKHPDIIVEHVMHDEMTFVCGPKHPFYGRENVSIRELDGMPLILREHGSGTRSQVETAMKTHHLELNSPWECCTADAIISAVMHSHAATIISHRLVREHAENGLVWSCPIPDVDFNRSFSLVYHKDKLITAAMAQFMKVCRNFEH